MPTTKNTSARAKVTPSKRTFTIKTRTFPGSDSGVGEFVVSDAEMPADNDVHKNSNRVGFARFTAAGRNAHYDFSVHYVTSVETKRDDERGWTTLNIRTAQGENVTINLFDDEVTA